MATYTIVSSTTNPLGPGELHAGSITVSDGDVFILDPSIDVAVNFVDGGGGPANFDIVINDSPTNAYSITIGGNLSTTVTIEDNVDLSSNPLDAQASDGVTLTAGDGVTMEGFDGSSSGSDTITVGNDFTATADWKLDGGENSLITGTNAQFVNVSTTGTGSDYIELGDGSSFVEIDTAGGNDTIRYGDNVTGSKLKAGAGDDVIYGGANSTVGEVDGQGGNDTFNTQDAGVNTKNLEATNVVCFAKGTRIATPQGEVAVEDLKPGQMVNTLDHGPQPLRWVGYCVISGEILARAHRLRPIRILANALGQGMPSCTLTVSPQHRILIQSPIAARIFGESEVLVAAKKLLDVDGISVVEDCHTVEYYHILFDRHEIVIAAGAKAESLFLGEQTNRTLTPEDLEEISLLLSGAETTFPAHQLARLSPEKRKVLGNLVARHKKNRKPFQTRPPATKLLETMMAGD